MKNLTLLSLCLLSAVSLAEPISQAQLDTLWKNKQKSAEEIVNNMSEAEKNWPTIYVGLQILESG